MKKVTLTNATVIPFYKNNPKDPDEVIRIVKPKEGSTFTSTIINFNVETKTVDSVESKARLFEKCTIYAKTTDQINNIKNIIKTGAIVELEGYEQRNKSEKDNKYYTNIIVRSMTPISSGIDIPDVIQQPLDVSDSSDDLPF